MYTDDPQFLVVGRENTKRALRVWRRLTSRLGLLMAIPEKRSLGSWSAWLGINIIPALGIAVVPLDKILRAATVIHTVLTSGIEFHFYRSLCGLLEHLRAVNLRGRNIMFGLYRPHGPTGASRLGPSGWVTCDELMTKQLQRWLRLLFQSCGVSFKQSVLRAEVEPPPQLFFDVTSDACLADEERAGIGGFMHGLYWFFEIPENDRPFLTIPVLEFLGVCFNILNFFVCLDAARREVQALKILLRTDA